MAPDRALPQKPKPSAAPHALLDTAFRLFGARGYRAVRLEEVAEAAGMTKGAIYYYFDSKEDLLRRALWETIHMVASEVHSDPAPLAELLRRLGQEGFVATRDSVCLGKRWTKDRKEQAMAVEERLKSQEVFSFLLPKQVDSISNAAQAIRYKEGDTVYSQGERAEFIYVVLEGEVMLRLPGKGGLSVPIDVATAGTMFGSCMCFDIESYSTTAQCTQDSKLLKIEAVALSDLMDEDLRMGYAMQRRLSQIYFNRYLNTMRKLQTVAMSLPVEAE